MAEPDSARRLLSAFWADLDGPPDLVGSVAFSGPPMVLPSIFDITGLATACAGAAALAVAELRAARTSRPLAAVSVDRLAASASFRFESLMDPVGWELPPIWDPVAGDYESADGWIRLHTNYHHHRTAVLEVLGGPVDRDGVADAVRRWSAVELEHAVVSAGGCAAAMRSAAQWELHPAGEATAAERPVVIGPPLEAVDDGVARTAQVPNHEVLDAPLCGIRVLDVTRVIAGPVATRYLAGYGADVLRIDPPGFEEVAALVPEATAGKRCAALELRSPEGRAAFVRLVAQADVLVGGLRPGALAGLGFGPEELREINPGLITATHDAYGWSGPWAQRRGFDSLVQMSTGIAAAGAVAAGVEQPRPLPAQALDHGVGHLLAAGICRALARRVETGRGADVRGSLVGAANVVRAATAPAASSQVATIVDARTEVVDTAWGPLRHAPLAGRVDGVRPRWTVPAGPLGRHEATFATGP